MKESKEGVFCFSDFPEPLDEEDKGLQKMANWKHRLLSKDEYQIGNTLFTVYSSVPDTCTDKDINEQTKEKIERLILNAAEEKMRGK